jgi:RHS repeat-associated protein
MVTSMQQGNITEAWTYNTFGELATQTSSLSGSALLALTYHSTAAPRDNLGRVVTKREVRGGVTTTIAYTYDARGQLFQVRTNGTLTEQYTYDDNGNRLTGLDAGATSAGTYDDQDRLRNYGDWAYAYTDNGELESKLNTTTLEAWTYAYDVLGNLRSVTSPDNRVVSYEHDGRNRRIAKRIDGVVVRRWVYGDQLNPVLETDGNGAPLFRYVDGSMAHSPDYVIDANGVNYRVLRDQLGSPLLIVNSANSADVLLNAGYSAFGRRTVTSSAAVIPTLGFAGGIYDEDTGLTRFGARDYDPVVGRWTAKDPIGWRGQQSNFYAYVGNDPVNTLDPSGLREYSTAETHAMLVEAIATYQNQSSPMAFASALGNNSMFRSGRYDFRFRKPQDTFSVEGLGQLTPEEFGNYFAGFVNSGAFGAFGLWGTQMGGHVFEFLEYATLDQPIDAELIARGAYDRRRRFENNDVNICEH